jgi:hypothetical protein
MFVIQDQRLLPGTLQICSQACEARGLWRDQNAPWVRVDAVSCYPAIYSQSHAKNDMDCAMCSAKTAEPSNLAIMAGVMDRTHTKIGAKYPTITSWSTPGRSGRELSERRAASCERRALKGKDWPSCPPRDSRPHRGGSPSDAGTRLQLNLAFVASNNDGRRCAAGQRPVTLAGQRSFPILLQMPNCLRRV